MSFSGIEDGLAFPIDYGCGIVQKHLSIDCAFFDVSEQYVAFQPFRQSRTILELRPFSIVDCRRKGIFIIFEVVSRKRHLWEDNDVDLLAIAVELQLLVEPLYVFLLFVENGVHLAENCSDGLSLIHME